jgi:hypothetical protein
VDFLFSGHSSISGNLVQLKVEKWETSDSICLRYKITYFLGKYISGEYVDNTFKTLNEVVKFIERTEPLPSNHSVNK